MADSFGWAGKVLRVDLTTRAITTESTDKYKPHLGGTGMGWKVLWDEVPAGTKAWDPENRLVFGTGPITGSGSPCSGRTSVITLWPVALPELPAAGHFGGHWGPELKYAGYDGIIIHGKSDSPVWLRIEDDKVTLEDASSVWGEGIYRTTNYVTNLMGADAHVVAIGPAGENLVRMAAVFCDRSHRGGGAGSVMGSKNLKAIGVRGTGAVRIAADKITWKSLNHYYLSLIGANNQCVVARELQPWSEYSPGNTRWSGRKGVLWGAAKPPIDVGTCPDLEHPTVDAPSPLNKIGMRTQKGYNDFSGAEGQRRTVRMDGCHACPIRCHIAAEHPELEQYGVTRFNMNTCMGNSGNATYSSTQQSAMYGVSGPMLLAYMANNLEGDYGVWNDYGGWHYVTKYLLTTMVDNGSGTMIPLLQKYVSAAEWTRLRTTVVSGYGKSPLAMLESGDPRWLQWIIPEVSSLNDDAPASGGKYTLAQLMGMGPPRVAALIPELAAAFPGDTNLHMWKYGHTLHHSVESMGWIGGIVNMMTSVRDPNTHTHHNFYTNGLPNSAAVPLQRAIIQEIATDGRSMFCVPDHSADGEWAYDLNPYSTYGYSPMNLARASIAAQSIVMYEAQNSLTECNYTLPIWASPLKSRNGTLQPGGYRGDTGLSAQVLSAVTGESYTQKDLEKAGLRNFVLYRVLLARYMQACNGTGANLRSNFDLVPEWAFSDTGTPSSSAHCLARTELDVAKNLMYQLFGFTAATGLPTEATLNDLGLGYVIQPLKSAGVLP